MRKSLFVAVLLFVPLLAFGQDDSWRDRPASRDRYNNRGADNTFDLTPFVGYRYGGTLYADQSNLFRTDVDVASSANFGLNVGIPIANGGMKLELMVDHQSTHLTRDSGLFSSGGNFGDMGITYYQAGLLLPFAQSRTVTPFVVFSAGVANLDPQINGVSSSNRFAASAGIGVKVPINRSVDIRVEARGFFTSTDNRDDTCSRCGDASRDLYQGETNFGFGFKF